MDPEATLLEAINHLANGRPNEAAECMDAYCTWRGRGGFQPTVSGDKLAEHIADLALHQAFDK